MNRRLNQAEISAIANCVRVAGDKFRENAKLLEAYPCLAEQFTHQADEAFELLPLLEASDEINLTYDEEMLDED